VSVLESDDWYASIDEYAGMAMLPLHLPGGTAGQVELTVFFLVGLLGGAHCLGMCGPLVTMYSERMATDRSSKKGVLSTYEVRQHALFNAGRTVSYALIGGIFGLAGSLVFGASAAVTTFDTPLRAGVGILTGVFIMAVGGRYVTGQSGAPSLLANGPISGFYHRAVTHIEEWVSGPGIFGLGLVHGLLPCPLLYPAFLYAFARGSPVGGIITLGILGLGTFPTLFLYGTVFQSIDDTHRQRVHRLLGVAFLAMGWMPIAHGLGLIGVPVPHIEPPIYQPLGS
jgi:sulfite exporter TauE/SafE